MRIPINKEIEKEYKDQFLRGFSMKECGFIALGLVILMGVGFFVSYFFKLPINICIYIGIPFAAPAVIIGFADFQGLTMVEFLKELIYEYRTKELYYDADEIKLDSPVFTMQLHEEEKKNKKRRRRKQK